MKRSLLITGLTLLSALAGYTAALIGHTWSTAAAQRPARNKGSELMAVDNQVPAVEYRSRRDIAATVTRLIDERQIGTPVIGTAADSYYLMVAHRGERGEAEMHATMDDIFFAHEGTAEVIVGGKMAGKEISAGEWRAPAIEGGRSITLSPGEVLRIPHGTPHQTIPRGKFTYLVVKVRAGS